MVMCSFCGDELKKGTGVMYAKRDGTLFYFCSSKCKKNQLGLGREGRKQKWTTSFKKYNEAVAKKKKQ
ncbi:MAG: 50S ribosomal protein L24e [Candidatus Micrarchaeia archaeon]|jgi:large subunit ribosomal protein L24e